MISVGVVFVPLRSGAFGSIVQDMIFGDMVKPMHNRVALIGTEFNMLLKGCHPVPGSDNAS